MHYGGGNTGQPSWPVAYSRDRDPALHLDVCQAPNGWSAARISFCVQDVRGYDNGAIDGKMADTCSPDLVTFLQNKDLCGVRTLPTPTHSLRTAPPRRDLLSDGSRCLPGRLCGLLRRA